MSSKRELINYIHYQLDQLGVENRHHDFEHLCRHFARLRICENILPATGPVSCGGDQGRDFETYRTYLTSTSIANSAFLGTPLTYNKKIVFACSLNKKIITKIKNDIKTICGCSIIPDGVYYFCTKDVPISKRHQLQDFARNSYHVSLEIFDGIGLSEALSDIDVFWIAMQYLHIPSDMFPKEKSSDEVYIKYKTRWSNETLIPQTYADFYQIKYGLRSSIFDTNERNDILFWIGRMRLFLGTEYPAKLKKRAIYEISRASLKGLNNLSAVTSLVEEYFSDIKGINENGLEDAVCLLSYCLTAQKIGHFDFNTETLQDWSNNLTHKIEETLKRTHNANSRANILMLRGLIVCNSLFSKGHIKSISNVLYEIIKWWSRALVEAKKAVLFPLEKFANTVNIIVPFAGYDPKFSSFVNRLDLLLIERTKGFNLAEACFKRSQSFYNNKQYLNAIKQLHKSKINWLAAETSYQYISSILLIAECYIELKLIYAAKYYIAAAIYIIYYHNNEELKKLLPYAFFKLVDCFYMGGEWLTFYLFIPLAINIYNQFDYENLEINKQDEVNRLYGHALIAYEITKRFNPKLLESILDLISTNPMSAELLEIFKKSADDTANWIRNSILEILWEKMQTSLAGRPFCDFGEKRKIIWKAYGILWSVEFKNDYWTNMVSEHVVATMQIILADLAGYDFHLIPTNVTISCNLGDTSDVMVNNISTNDVAMYQVIIPRTLLSDYTNEYKIKIDVKIYALIIMLIRHCSLLPENKFNNYINQLQKDDMFNKTFIGLPYIKCYKELIIPDDFNTAVKQRFSPFNPTQSFNFGVSAQ